MSVQLVEGALSPFSKSGRQPRGLSMGASAPAICFRVPAQGPAVWGLGARRGHTGSKAFVYSLNLDVLIKRIKNIPFFLFQIKINYTMILSNNNNHSLNSCCKPATIWRASDVSSLLLCCSDKCCGQKQPVEERVYFHLHPHVTVND